MSHPLQILRGHARHLSPVDFYKKFPTNNKACEHPFAYDSELYWTKGKPTDGDMGSLLGSAIKRDIGRKRSEKLLQQLAAERSTSRVEPDHALWDFERSVDIQPPKAMHKKYPFALPDAVIATSKQCS
jgi:hypothetical protein